MERDINDFITIVRQKNGIIKITHNLSNEGNIYKLLRDLGFRKAKLNKKYVYFRRESGTLILSSFQEMKDAFRDILGKYEFTNIPDDIRYDSVLNWYHNRRPIKENGLFNHYLKDSLTEFEGKILVPVDPKNKARKFNTENLQTKLDELKFKSTVDKIGTFCINNPLYYKKVGENKYLIFNHFNSKNKNNDGFDSWLATYSTENQIGSKKPLLIEDIRLNYILDRDFELIENYLH